MSNGGCYGMTACGMGEPKVYGGYGMGATAVQEPYTGKPKAKPQLDVWEPGKKSGWEKRSTAHCRCVETGEVFESFKDCAETTGIDYTRLRNSFRRKKQVTISGYTIERMK